MLDMLNLRLIYSGKRKIILLFSKHAKMASGTPNNILATDCKLNNKKKKLKSLNSHLDLFHLSLVSLANTGI